MALSMEEKMLFPLGFFVITRSVMAKIHPNDVGRGLVRHVQGDWGEVDKEDWKANDAALKHSLRLHSSYLDRHGRKFWLITEWDRSVTTALLPEEY